MADRYDIKPFVREEFCFSNDEIAQFLIAYNLPSWPKALKRTKLEWLEYLIKEKLWWITRFGCVESDINNLSKLLIDKCLFACDIAEYAQKIPIIGKMIKIGKFPVVLKAMKAATLEYVYYRSTWHSADESLDYAKFSYWNDIRETLDTWGI